MDSSDLDDDLVAEASHHSLPGAPSRPPPRVTVTRLGESGEGRVRKGT